MGRDIKPLCSYWDGEKLDYVNARKRIYIPLYADAVSKTKAFQQLKDLYQEKGKIALVDFDSHGLTPNTFDYWDLWNNPEIKVGHGYVLAMLLEGKLC